MTISSNDRIAQYTGNGTSTFSFQFKVFQASDLLVVKQDAITGIETTLTLTTDYTVTLNADQNYNPGGNVITTSPVAVNYNLTITSNIENLQPTDLSNQGGFYPDVINDSLDRATIQIQQLSDLTARSMLAPVSDGLTNNLELPSAATRANKFLAFNASGVPMAAAGTNTGNNTSAGNLTLTANNAGSNVARNVIFYDNATETMRIDRTTNPGATRVGIGTNAPVAKLQVHNPAAADCDIRVTNTASGASVADGLLLRMDSVGQALIYNGENAPMLFGTNNTQRMTIAADGKVTTGTMGVTAEFVCGNQDVTGTGGSLRLTGVGGTNYIQSGANLTTGSAAPLVFTTTNGSTEWMRIAADGKVGIGTSNPNAVLDLGGQGLGRGITWTATGATEPNNNIFSSYGGVGLVFAAGVAPSTSADSYLSPNSASIGRSMIRMDAFGSNAGTMQFYTNAASAITAGNAVTPTERMRILSAGQLCVNSTGVLSTTNRVNVVYPGGTQEYGMGFRPVTATTTTATTAITFEQSTGTSLGSISHPTTGGTVYNTTSDYRLKTNVTPISNALDRIDALKPCNYTWIDSGVASEGFIAHELQEVIPQAVTGIKDEVDDQGNIRAQGVDHSRVVPTLTAAIKDLKAIVEAQAARIAALEATP